MATEEHLAKLREGVDAWNQWRLRNPELKPNLIGADLTKAHLSGADLTEANLIKANLSGTDLREATLTKAKLSRAALIGADLGGADLGGADLVEADLRGAYLDGAYLVGANLIMAKLIKANLACAVLERVKFGGANLAGANLSETRLTRADLSEANFSGADLREADLSRALLVRTRLDDAHLNYARVYGTSVWDVSLKGTSQRNLVITPYDEDTITVDNLKLAQFIYLLLKNEEVRHIIDTITSKVVLILGRFTDERKQVLDALRNELRTRDYTPILFDFDKPASRDLTETISTLAHMARFVIADISSAKSIPQELSHIIPNLPSVPVQPVLLESDREYAMFEHWKRYPWVLPDFLYEDEAHLLASLTDKVIEPAERKRHEQTEA